MYHNVQVLYLQGKEKDSEALIQDSIRILEVHHYLLESSSNCGHFSVLALLLTVKFCLTA